MGFLTITGENTIAQKQGAGLPLNITGFVLAHIPDLGAEPVNRIPTLPSTNEIVHSQLCTLKGYLQANQVVYSIVMDSSVGDFVFNWIGLEDDEGNFIGVSYIPLIEKRKTNGSVQGNNMTRSFIVEYSGIAATTGITVPAETWQIDFATRLHGIDDRARLSNFDIYGHESFIDNAFSVTAQSGDDYAIATGIAYVGGIRCTLPGVSTITAVTKPTSIWMDVSLQGNVSDVAAVITFAVNAAVQSDHIDGLGFNHYLTKLADIAADGSVTDTRDTSGLIDEKITAHEAKADPHGQYLTRAEADAFYDTLGISAADVAAHLLNSDPHPQYTTDADVDAKIAATAALSLLYFMGQL